jgi:pyruvate dehydrogenase E2 component (dihydrolipoamide acetyltransferase)
VRAVPAARALARGLGVDLAAVTGSGDAGLVTIADVLAHAGAGAGTARVAAAATAAAATVPALEPPVGAAAEVQELRGPRRAMAQSMSSARDGICGCTVFDDANLARWDRRGDYSVRLLRAIVAAVRAEPALNAWYDAPRQRRLLFEDVDVGLAVDTPDGLIVPVMRHVQSLDAGQLRSELDRLKRAARDRSLRSEELRHSTIMLSNFGTLAGRYATPVVVPPAVAILGTGRVRQDVVAVDDRAQLHWRMPLSLSFDHRVVTGGEAVRFLGALIADLELPQ